MEFRENEIRNVFKKNKPKKEAVISYSLTKK